MLRILTIIACIAVALVSLGTPAHAQSVAPDSSLSFATQSEFAPGADLSTSNDISTDDNNDLYALGGVALLAWGIDYSLRSHSSSISGTPVSGLVGVAPEISTLSLCLMLLAIAVFVSVIARWHRNSQSRRYVEQK